MNVNQVALSGNLARDAELKQTRGGKPVISFPLALAESVPDGQGGRTERASYFDVVCFFGSDRLAGILSKGQKVAVQGRLRQRTSRPPTCTTRTFRSRGEPWTRQVTGWRT